MLDQRMQILLTSDQKQRLEAEAKRRNASVGSLIREAVDAKYREPLDAKLSAWREPTREERIMAIEKIVAMRAPTMTLEQMDAIVEEAHDADFEAMMRGYE